MEGAEDTKSILFRDRGRPLEKPYDSCSRGSEKGRSESDTISWGHVLLEGGGLGRVGKRRGNKLSLETTYLLVAGKKNFDDENGGKGRPSATHKKS